MAFDLHCLVTLKVISEKYLVDESARQKDPGRRFQNPIELLKVIPTMTGGMDARRRITRQSLQKMPSTDAFLDDTRATPEAYLSFHGKSRGVV